jgi:nucleoid-associated protein YgaU
MHVITVARSAGRNGAGAREKKAEATMGIFDKDKKDDAGAGAMAGVQQLSALKQKYQSVLNTMNQHQVKIKSVQVENGKLVVRGEAPSADVKNKIWDQIKLVDAAHADLTADISVAPGVGGPAGAVAAPKGGTYTVQQGDTLSKISKQHYGDGNKYMKIFDANKDKLKDPDKIQVGQVLTIPPA